MNPLEQLLSLPADERAQRGLAHTPAEIAQQPDTWIETAALVRAAAPALRALRSSSGWRWRQGSRLTRRRMA